MFKKYMDIQRIKANYADGFVIGDKISITEKVDGANFSIKYDSKTNSVRAFSRNKELDVTNTLSGAWEYAQRLDINKVKEALGENIVLFGEWLIQHTVRHPQDAYKKMYVFDAWNVETSEYLPQEEVKKLAEIIGLTYVPVFYEGEFISWEHVKSFVGKTALGGENGEGVVVKNMSRINDPNTRFPFYVKIVADSFAETKKIKVVDMDKVNERARLQELTESIVTEARVRKILHKMVDEGILRHDWDETDMRTIAQNMGKAVYADCVKEEPETVEQIDNFGKHANGVAMRFVRKILEERCI